MARAIKHVTSRSILQALKLEDIKDREAFLLLKDGAPSAIRMISGVHVEIYRTRGFNDFIVVTKAKGGGEFGAIKFLALPEQMGMVAGAAIAMSDNLLIPVYV